LAFFFFVKLSNYKTHKAIAVGTAVGAAVAQAYTMWVEMWSEKHQRPYFYNNKNKKTAWKGHRSTGQQYDELPCAKTGRLEVALMSVREHNRFVKRGLMWHDLEQLKATNDRELTQVFHFISIYQFKRVRFIGADPSFLI